MNNSKNIQEEEEHKQAVREASFVTQLSKESAEKDK